MTTPAQRSALAALQAARPTIERLESEQNSEDRAADLIEGWSAVETALRSLVGGSTLTGRGLIHELRSRHVITLEQANALAEFEAARTRAERMAYEPTETDVAAARDAFTKLESGLRAADSGAPAGAMTGAAAGSTAAGSAAATSNTANTTGAPIGVTASGIQPARPDWLRWAIGAAAVIVVVALGTWLLMRSSGGSTLDRAVEHYKAGQREQAAAAFERAAREDPKNALPHIYLSRLARDVGNLTLARDEAHRAIQKDSRNALALREMGAYLLTTGNYELARRFYVRAVEADTSDRTAQGYLGCSLIRLGRRDEGLRWLTRAGQGNWSSCATMAPGAAMPGMPGAMPPGQLPPQPLPPSP
ncbi:MAG: tetratricopeptide repeat protein [Gemmatimonadaceae bacterium]